MLRAENGLGLQRSVQVLVLSITLIGLCLGLTGCSLGQPGLTDAELEAKIEQALQNQEDTSSDLEKQVIAIIKDNPDVIIESVQAYQQEQQQNQAKAREEQQAEAVAELTSDLEALVAESPRRGAESFDLVLVEFSDFQCPFCARATATVDRFMDNHGDEVMLVFKHLPLASIHPQALPAAVAAWAAQQQGKFWEYHDLLFENQARLGDEFYLEAAEELGLDIDQFNTDRESDEAEKAVQQDLQLAQQLQINGTPFFLLNGQTLSGARPYDDFEEALEAAKAE